MANQPINYGAFFAHAAVAATFNKLPDGNVIKGYAALALIYGAQPVALGAAY